MQEQGKMVGMLDAVQDSPQSNSRHLEVFSCACLQRVIPAGLVDLLPGLLEVEEGQENHLRTLSSPYHVLYVSLL